MRLRSMAAAAALGAAVLTTVPAATVPYTAYACEEDSQSACDEHDDDEGEHDPGDWDDPGGEGDPGDDGNDDGGGNDGGGGASDGGDPDVSSGQIGDPVTATLPTVVIVGKAAPPPIMPTDPYIPSFSWGGGEGGGGGRSATVHSKGRKWEEPQNCYRNNSNVAQKLSDTVSYSVSFKVSANLSASAGEVLSATLGAELNTTTTRTYGVEVTLNPGESWGLFVEYQTNVYAVTTSDAGGRYNTEYVNVTAPTGVQTGRSC
ncbi:DUF6426 family protein [Streptomyces sp. NPDC059828]|uniref:DUF6426 family protein n=1 Tax=Streptomyces sp. NPDC059828 TaxID=3346965 RepID=UPI0036660883